MAGRRRQTRAVVSVPARLPGPVRTCVGCRVRAAKATLLRVVAVEDQGILRLVLDPERRLPGRGAHLHPHPACVELAERRRAFVRALRLGRPPDATALRDHLQPLPHHPSDESRSTSHEPALDEHPMSRP